MEDVSCTFHPPEVDAWVFLVGYHAMLLLGGGVPIGLWAYFEGRHKPRCCTVLALMVASSLPFYLYHQHHLGNIGDSSPPMPIAWIGRFLASTFGFSTAFKLWNVAFHQYPEGADVSVRTFMLWFLILPEPQFTKGKTRTLSAAEVKSICVAPLQKFVALSILLSILTTPNLGFHEESNNKSSTSLLIRIMQLLPTKGETLIQEAWNGWIHLWWLYLFVSLLLELSAALSLPLTGYQAMDPAFQNPLLESRTLQEFWGSRWNVPVQVLLQRTVYIPLRKQGYSRPIAILGTFLFSGLLHEYTFSTHNYMAYQQFGVAILFFVFMGGLMLVEQWISTNIVQPRRQNVARRVPSFVLAFGYMMLSAVPVERYFIRSWLDAGMIDAVSLLVPHITCS